MRMMITTIKVIHCFAKWYYTWRWVSWSQVEEREKCRSLWRRWWKILYSLEIVHLWTSLVITALEKMSTLHAHLSTAACERWLHSLVWDTLYLCAASHSYCSCAIFICVCDCVCVLRVHQRAYFLPLYSHFLAERRGPMQSRMQETHKIKETREKSTRVKREMNQSMKLQFQVAG